MSTGSKIISPLTAVVVGGAFPAQPARMGGGFFWFYEIPLWRAKHLRHANRWCKIGLAASAKLCPVAVFHFAQRHDS